MIFFNPADFLPLQDLSRPICPFCPEAKAPVQTNTIASAETKCFMFPPYPAMVFPEKNPHTGF